jgi:hypothetical protein
MNENTPKSLSSELETGNAEKPLASMSAKIISLILALLVMVLSGGQQYLISRGGIPEAIGGSIGALLFPLISIAVFQIWKRFRNQKSRYTIFLWVVSVICVSYFVQLFQLLAKITNA